MDSNSDIGGWLQRLARDKSFSSYVEIGTAHGLGSTRVLMEALSERDDESALWSLEALESSYLMAVNNWQQHAARPRLKLLHGVIIKPDEMMTWEEVVAHPLYGKVQDYCHKKYPTYKDICNNAPFVLESLPKTIDVLLLDGGEFSSYAEFRKLEARTNGVCVLDDSHHAIKNYNTREHLEQSPDWCLVVNNPNSRNNGWCVFCRPQWLAHLQPSNTQPH